MVVGGNKTIVGILEERRKTDDSRVLSSEAFFKECVYVSITFFCFD
jgi:hypothetical protein